MVQDESGRPVPEVIAAMNLRSCSIDPVPAFIPVLSRLLSNGVKIGDILTDSGYAYRVPEHWAIPIRMMGANIVTDLHPNDRGRQGTFGGATAFNGNLYCPATPEALFEISPLARSASPEEICACDEKAGELARYKLGRISRDDPDGYHRVGCPGAAGKVRCPLQPASMALGFDRPEILEPPKNPPTCCSQQTMSLMLACALVVSNLAVIDAFEARQIDNAQRVRLGKDPRTRKRRRKTLADIAGANAPPGKADLLSATA